MDPTQPAWQWRDIARYPATHTPHASSTHEVRAHRYARLFHQRAEQIGQAPLMNCANGIAHGVLLARAAQGDLMHQSMAPTASVVIYAQEAFYHEVARVHFEPQLSRTGRRNMVPVAEHWPTPDLPHYPELEASDWLVAAILERHPDATWHRVGNWVHHVGVVANSVGPDGTSFWDTEVASIDSASRVGGRRLIFRQLWHRIVPTASTKRASTYSC